MEAPRIVGLILGLGLLGLLFAFAERRWQSVPGPAWYRRPDVGTDLVYWFFTPIVSRAFTQVVLGLVILAVFSARGGSADEWRAAVRTGAPPDLGWPWLAARLRALPFVAQLGLGLAVADLLGYWLHRAFHRGRLWGLHAVHHGSPRLDWLSSVRVHPLNQAVMRAGTALPLLLLGFDVTVFAVVAPFMALYGVLLHANLGWSLGPLRHVIATPRFHRWHHTAQAEGRDRNFAGLLPIWDRLFGTLHLPRDEVPREFGAGDEPVPAGFWRQLAYPFRTPPPGARLARDP